MSVSQRLEALRTKRDGPRVSFGGTRDDAPKQEAPDRSVEERPMSGGCFVVRVGLHQSFSYRRPNTRGGHVWVERGMTRGHSASRQLMPRP